MPEGFCERSRKKSAKSSMVVTNVSQKHQPMLYPLPRGITPAYSCAHTHTHTHTVSEASSTSIQKQRKRGGDSR